MCYFINLKIRLNTGIFNNILVCKEQINVEINKERIFVRLRSIVLFLFVLLSNSSLRIAYMTTKNV